jgi:hypothetical protein
MQSTSVNDEFSILYNSYAVCPICSFVEGKGVDKSQWKRSQVVNHRNQVYQRIECDVHGLQTLLLCSNAAFFDRCLSFTPGVLDVKSKSSLLDIEELDKRIKQDSHTSTIMNVPFMVSCNLYENEKFLSEDAIRIQLEQILQLIPEKKNFVLKLNVQLVPLSEMNILNQRVGQILSYTNRIADQPIILECTFDRISQLSKLDDTVLLNSRIYPSVQIYIDKGREASSAKELKHAHDTLKAIRNLQVIVRLVLSRPFPDLSDILKYLRFEMVGFTRFIILEMERTPAQIMKQFRPSENVENIFAEVHQQADYSHSLDPLELLYNIEKSTDGQVAINDFYPASVGIILEPLLRLVGKGNYNIRPSPFCGFATVLVNTDAQFKSVPVSRVFNIDTLYKHMVPLVKKIEKADGVLGFFTARALKKAVNQSIIPKKFRKDEFEIPSDFMTFLISEDKQSETTELLDKMQFLIIHNQMDVGSVDIVKRSRCSLCSHTSTGSDRTKGKLNAQCTKCL